MLFRFVKILSPLTILLIFAGITPSQTLRPNEVLIQRNDLNRARSFAIQAKANDVISIQIKQNGIDIAAKLLGPNNTVAAEADYPFSEQETERIFIIAQVDGVFRLEVSPKFRANSGSYEVELKESRRATQDDIQSAAAELQYGEAQRLRQTGRANDRRQAIVALERSLELWTSANDRSGEIRAMSLISYLNRIVGKYKESLELAERILRFPELPEFQSYKLDARYQIAQIHFLSGRVDQAINTLNESLAQWPTASPQQALIFNAIGNYHQTNADFELAEKAFDQALGNTRQFPDIYNEAQIRHTLGLLHIKLKDFNSAIENLEVAAAMREKFGNRRGYASAMTQLGMCYFYSGNIPRSKEYLEKALPISRELEDKENIAITLSILAVDYRESSNGQKAVELLKEAVSLYADTGSTELNTAYITLGVTQTQVANYAEARENFEKALLGYRRVGDLDGVARATYQYAKLERAINDLDAAKLKIESAMVLLEYVQAKFKNVGHLTRFLEFHRGYFDLYIDVLMRLDAARPGEGYALKAFQASEAARMRTLIWEFREAIGSDPQSIDFQLLSEIQKNRLLVGERLSDLAKAQSNPQRAGSIADLEKAISDLNKQDETLKARLRLRNPKITNLAQPPSLSLPQVQAELGEGTALAEYSLGEERSYLWIVDKSGLQSYALPKRQEIEEQAKIFYELLSPTGKDQDRRIGSKVDKKDPRTASSKAFLAQSASLGKLLAVDKIAGLSAKRLVIVSGGALNLIPFSSLGAADSANGTGMLADSFELIQLPSLTTLHVLRQSGTKPFRPNSMAVLADPVFSNGDERLAKSLRTKSAPSTQNIAMATTLRDFNLTSLSRLPFTRIEAEQIAKNLPNDTSVNLDFAANRDRLFGGAFDRYDILHFATHGFLNNAHPELSGIVLSLVDNKGAAQNGFLRAQDLYLLKLKPQMVVLSACQTGIGKQIGYEGLVGITRGFLANGTQRVISTLWKVDDAATAEFMNRFYRALLKEGQLPSQALRTAQNELRQIPRFTHPHFWAGFTLTGEWR